MSKTQSPVGERAQNYLKENEETLRRYKLASLPVINFPFRRKPPILSRIALWIVVKQGGQLDTQFRDLVKQ
jgi:hypothetical protein